MNKRSIFSALLAAVLTIPAAKADEFRVESKNGVPQILRNGKSVPPYMLYVNTFSWEVTFANEKWQNIDLRFLAMTDAPKAEIVIGLPFPGSHRKFTNTLEFAGLKLIDKTTGKVIFNFDNAETFNKHFIVKNNHGSNGAYKNDSGTLKSEFTEKDGKKIIRLTGKNSGAWVGLQLFEAVKSHEYQLTGQIRSLEGKQPVNCSLYNTATHMQIVAPNKVLKEQVKLAAAAGVDLVNIRAFPVFVKPGEKPDFSDLDYVFDGVIEANPKAQIIVRLRSNVPEWWLNQNPEELIINLPNGNNRVPSPSSEKYRNALKESLRMMIRHCEEKYPNNIAGWHPTGCGNDEWYYITAWNRGTYCDYSVPAQKAFRKFLEKRYRTNSALQKAWGKADVTFANAQIPAVKDRISTLGNIIFKPSEQPVIDHNDFQQENMAGIIIDLGKAIRKEVGRKRLISCFYGYTTECSAYSNGPAISGHYGLRKVLESDAYDILIGPYDYNYREFGGICATLAAADSIMMAGKLWLQEDDTHTYLAHETGHKAAGFEKAVTTFPETLLVLRRNLLTNTLRNYATWWMDIGGTGYYNDVRLWDEIRRFAPVEKNLRENPQPYAPEFAAVFDEASMSYIKPNGVYTASRPMIKADREDRGKAGISFGEYLFDDYLAGKMPSKYDVLISAYVMDAVQRETVRRLSQKKPTIFCWGSGMIDKKSGEISLKAVEETTGFAVKFHTGKVLTHKITEAGKKLGLELRRPPMPAKDFEPLFTPVLAKNDIVWATFENGDPAVVFRPGKVPTLFCGTPNLPRELYRAFVTACGGKLPVSGNASIVSNGPYTMVSILTSAKYTINPDGSSETVWKELAPKARPVKKGPLIRRIRKGEVILLEKNSK